MDKNEFITRMTDFADTYGESVTQTIVKPRGNYTGLFLRADGATPVVNLDALYGEYQGGRSINSCYDYIDHIFKQTMPTMDMSVVMEWDQAREHLCLHLYGSAGEDSIYRKVEDLYMVPYIQISSDDHMGVRVTQDLLNIWGVDEDEVFYTAIQNQEKLRPVEIQNIAEVLHLPVTDIPMYLVTTSSHNLGAIAIFYSGVFNKVRELVGGEFFIIPSSIDEVLIFPKTPNSNLESIANMVRLTNQATVPKEDRLSNSVYTYDFEAEQFKKVG